MKNVCKYTDGYKYQLSADYTQKTAIKPSFCAMCRYVSLDIEGTLTINAGYAWDGPSGPSFDTKSFMRGSLVHDALYQLMAEGGLSKKYRDEADSLLRQICLEDGMSRFRAWYVYRAVRFFGRYYAVKRPTLIAP